MNPRVSLDQWRAFVAVVDHGGYAQAAEALHKTQSSVSYAVHRIESLLDVHLFQRQGRRAVLTPGGQVLYQRATTLLDRAGSLERGAAEFGPDWTPELRLAVEIVFPTWVLLEALDQFGARFPQTRVQLYETVLGGMDEALLERRVDLALTPFVPRGFAGDPLLDIRFIAAAHPDHPLHHLGRPVTLDDLRDHRQLVIRDSAQERPRDSGGWLGAEQRWTVSHKATQIRAACMGMGFAWFPEQAIRHELDEGRLAPLPMREGGERYAQVYLVYTDPDAPPRAAAEMAEILRTMSMNRDRLGSP
ncbi:LysR family transcriptional regulator [Marinihelvus fidelis]|uniref:LysR family transcriptional regulator n=1 Tax=Marinihelvus fidelis TaxID=2613842 RepID=UPI001CD63CF0|nr:LysR family transcriptional regulator [Marinihelvus fidelis]